MPIPRIINFQVIGSVDAECRSGENYLSTDMAAKLCSESDDVMMNEASSPCLAFFKVFNKISGSFQQGAKRLVSVTSFNKC